MKTSDLVTFAGVALLGVLLLNMSKRASAQTLSPGSTQLLPNGQVVRVGADGRSLVSLTDPTAQRIQAAGGLLSTIGNVFDGWGNGDSVADQYVATGGDAGTFDLGQVFEGW